MIDRRFLDISLVVEGVADEPEKFDVGTQYIVGENPSGDFENAQPAYIARYDGEKWIFMPPKGASLEVINAGSGFIMSFDGKEWKPEIALVKCMNSDRFYIADYFTDWINNSTLKTKTGYKPNKLVIEYINEQICKVYRANEDGELVEITSQIPVGASFLYIKDGNWTDLVGNSGVFYWEKNENYKENYGFSLGKVAARNERDIVFCQENKHFYKFGAESYSDLGTELSTAFLDDIDNAIAKIDFHKHRTFIVIDNFGYSCTIDYINNVHYPVSEENEIWGTVFINPYYIYLDRNIYSVHSNDLYNLGRIYHLDKYPCVFASKTDGMLYSKAEKKGRITKEAIPDGAALFDKHNGVLYVYHASEDGFEFEKVSTRTYTVDGTVDYACFAHLESNPEKNTIKEGSKRLTNTAIEQYHNNLWEALSEDYAAVGKKYLALEDYYHNKIRIFERISGDDWRSVYACDGWLWYELEAGDTVISKDDGKIYLFDGTALTACNMSSGGTSSGNANTDDTPSGNPDDDTSESESEIYSVVEDMLENCVKVNGTEGLPPAEKNLRRLDISDQYVRFVKEEWNGEAMNYAWTATGVELNSRYASLTDFKIYKAAQIKHADWNQEIAPGWEIAEIPDGSKLLNKRDNCIYTYDAGNGKFTLEGVNKVKGKVGSSIAPVICIISEELKLPNLSYEVGDRFACSENHKIYEYNGESWTVFDVPDGGMFLNKLNNCIYVYDAKSSAFRNTDTSVPENNIFAVVNDIEYQSENAKNGYVYASLNASIICKIYQAGNEITEIPDGSGILNRHDNCIYIFDANNKKFKKVISEEDDSTINTGNNTVTETHVLTEYEANDCGFNLNYNVASGAEGSTLLSLNGMFMIFGVDYTISEQHTVTWRGWDGNIGYHIYRLYKRKLKAGDIFTVQYTKE